VTVSEPTGSAVVANEHVPLARVQLPSDVLPLVKVTVPVALDEVTVAFRLTLLPKVVDDGVAVTVVVVVSLAMVTDVVPELVPYPVAPP
jgi:hypothetical protein